MPDCCPAAVHYAERWIDHRRRLASIDVLPGTGLLARIAMRAGRDGGVAA